jgi:hypothetical protein
LHTMAQLGERVLGRGCIDRCQPPRRTRYGPFGQRQPGDTMHAPPESAPAPLVGSGDQFRTPRVRLHVAAYGKEVFVGRDRETLEATLVKMSTAARRIVLVVSADVRHPHPAQPASQRRVRPGPQSSWWAGAALVPPYPMERSSGHKSGDNPVQSKKAEP